MTFDDLHELLRRDGFLPLFLGHPDAISVFSADGRFVMANTAMLARSGSSADQLFEAPFRGFFPAGDPDFAEAEFAAAVAGQQRQYLVSGVRVDGVTVRSRISLVPFIEGGSTAAVFAMSRELGPLEDVAAEARLSDVLASISDAVIFIDRDWRITDLNPRASELLGTDKDAIGRVTWNVFPERAGEFSIAYRQAVRENRTVNVRDFYVPLQKWLEATISPTVDGLAIALRDVSESESVRQELLALSSEVLVQNALLDSARDAIIVREMDGTIRYLNAAASRLYGWSIDEVVGQEAREVLYAEPDQFDRAWRATLRNGRWSGELSQVDKNGGRLDVESTWTLVRDALEQPESVISVNTDVTEKKRREALDLRTERMESLGTLASGIAHDLNNVLTPILMAVQLLTPGESDPARLEILRSTELAVKRGADMIRQVLSFASGANGRRVPVEIGDVLAEIESLRLETVPADVTLTFDVAAGLWPTSGDPTQLLQVLLNLVKNAGDAMPDGGSIVIRAQNITLTDNYSSVSHLATPGEYVQVEIEDTGAGMSSDVLGRIFEPFFTTKETGSGTGLGLSTSIAIIRGHGGYMQAYSEPGRGSIFRLHLRADMEGQAADASAIADLLEELPRGNGELVLVVDDEAAIRVLTRQTLEAYGYATAVAGNGAEAIEFIESNQTVVDLVLTDMAMPVMDGAATAAYLLRHHPLIPVIAASGLSANGGVARAKDSGVRLFLAKPYTTTELLRAISDALHPDQVVNP